MLSFNIIGHRLAALQRAADVAELDLIRQQANVELARKVLEQRRRDLEAARELP
jgi:hypothetical protein